MEWKTNKKKDPRVSWSWRVSGREVKKASCFPSSWLKMLRIMSCMLATTTTAAKIASTTTAASITSATTSLQCVNQLARLLAMEGRGRRRFLNVRLRYDDGDSIFYILPHHRRWHHCILGIMAALFFIVDDKVKCVSCRWCAPDTCPSPVFILNTMVIVALTVSSF